MAPITRNDVVRLLALCAADDQRTVGAEDVDLWFGVAQVEGWTARAAARVIVEHASRGDEKPRLTAAAITDRIRAVRSRAADTFPLPVIPTDLSNAEYPEWLRARRDAHRDALVEQWADSGQEPPLHLPPGPPPNQLGQRRMAELTAGAFHDMPTAGRDGTPPTVEEAQGRRDALAVPCPYCSARPGHPCTRSGASGRVRMKFPHPARGTRSDSEEAS